MAGPPSASACGWGGGPDDGQALPLHDLRLLRLLDVDLRGLVEEPLHEVRDVHLQEFCTTGWPSQTLGSE